MGPIFTLNPFYMEKCESDRFAPVSLCTSLTRYLCVTSYLLLHRVGLRHGLIKVLLHRLGLRRWLGHWRGHGLGLIHRRLLLLFLGAPRAPRRRRLSRDLRRQLQLLDAGHQPEPRAVELGHQPSLDVVHLRRVLGDVRGQYLRQSPIHVGVFRFQSFETRAGALQRRETYSVSHLQHLVPAPVQHVLHEVAGVGARGGERVQTRVAVVTARGVKLIFCHSTRERLAQLRRFRQVPVP
mmetsp:Transcript_12115/g.55052  ORF Transcript_12115/g.55052 Transcript_12115/m.55052 type:complete len:238 (+) Transcript_12115:3-716(+)